MRVFSQPEGASRKATSYGVRKRTTNSSTIMKRSHQWHQLVLFGSITQRDDDACAIACFIAPTSVRSLSADFRCASHALSLSESVFCRRISAFDGRRNPKSFLTRFRLCLLRQIAWILVAAESLLGRRSALSTPGAVAGAPPKETPRGRPASRFSSEEEQRPARAAASRAGSAAGMLWDVRVGSQGSWT